MKRIGTKRVLQLSVPAGYPEVTPSMSCLTPVMSVFYLTVLLKLKEIV